MLPDHPALRDEIGRFLNRYLRLKVRQHSGPFAQVQQSIIHEGRGSSIVRETGREDNTKIRSVSAEFRIDYDEVERLTLRDVMQRFDQLAQSIAEQQKPLFYEEIRSAAENVGNVMDAKGAKLSAEIILDTLEKIWIEFDKEGNPKLPTIIVPSSMQNAVKEISDEFNRDPSLRAKHRQILERKKREFNDRETSRTLVG